MVDDPKKKKKDANPFLGYLVVLCILIGILLLFVFGCFIYNIPNLLSKASLFSLVLSCVFCFINRKKHPLLDGYFSLSIVDILFLIVSTAVIVFFLWQICLSFITIACIPLLKRLFIPLFLDIVQYVPSLGISDTSGLIGALIGGLFSILAVKITITSNNNKKHEDEINLASPRLVFSIVRNDTVKVIGNGVIVHDSKENEDNNYLSYYILNLGGDAIDIILRADWKYRATWLYHQYSLNAFPVLRKGETLEVKFDKNILNLTKSIELDYYDAFSNKYTQNHNIRLSKGGQVVSTMPYRIHRDIDSSNIWKIIRKSYFFGKSQKEEQIHHHYDFW